MALTDNLWSAPTICYAATTPTAEATDGLEQLTLTIQRRILTKIRWLSENLDDSTPQALSADLSRLFKLRVGDCRII